MKVWPKRIMCCNAPSGCGYVQPWQPRDFYCPAHGVPLATVYVVPQGKGSG